MLEASRRQGKYWQTLEALLGSQSQWAVNHSVQQELVLPAIAHVGLDIERLEADMNAPEVAQRMQQDRGDAVTDLTAFFVPFQTWRTDSRLVDEMLCLNSTGV